MDQSFGFTTIAVVAPSDLLGYCAAMGLNEGNCTIKSDEGSFLVVLVANELIDWEDAREQFYDRGLTDVQYKLVTGNAKRRSAVKEVQLPEVSGTRSKAPGRRLRGFGETSESETVA